MPQKSFAPGATGRITIDLGTIASNWKSLAERVAPAECAAVVKADAYGLGADRVVPTLSAAGCTTFFVATLGEAQQVAALTKGARIFVLDGLVPGSGAALAKLGGIPVLSSLEEIADWRIQAKQLGHALPAALQVDSGLHRLGLSASDVAHLAQNPDTLEGCDIALIMSHLASADTPEARENAAQLDVFKTLLAQLPAAPASLAASDGLMLGAAYHFDLVRPGYALYGGQAYQGEKTPVAPVVQVTAQMVQVRNVPAGGSIGYSASFRAENAMRVAIVAVGYADGVPRTASAATGQTGGVVAINGHTANVVGRVSMDLIAVDVTHVPTALVQRGAAVELIGPTVPLDEVGAAAGTIGYEILTRLSPRFERVYLEPGEH